MLKIEKKRSKLEKNACQRKKMLQTGKKRSKLEKDARKWEKMLPKEI
jgi:hypothetical protein